MLSIRYIRYYIFGFFLLFLFHFESLSIGPLKISHLWKGMVLVLLVFHFLFSKKFKLFIYKPLVILPFLLFFNQEFFENPFNVFLTISINLIIPFFGIYIIHLSEKQLQKWLLFFASFFVLSFMPYQLGLLQSYGEGYNLEKYGAESYGLVGPYQGVHAASIALAASFIILVYFWIQKTYNRQYLSLLIILCLFFLINVYVRTGLAMALIGILPMIVKLYRQSNKKTRRSIKLVSLVIPLLLLYQISQNEILQKRITGNSKYGQENNIEKYGSGRGLIYITNFKIFYESNIIEKFIGMGSLELMRRTNQKIGIHVLSHNGFLTILLSQGVLGLTILITFYINVYNVIKRLPKDLMPLGQSLFIAFLIMTFIQTYNFFYFHIIFLLSITLLIKKKVNQRKFNNMIT